MTGSKPAEAKGEEAVYAWAVLISSKPRVFTCMTKRGSSSKVVSVDLDFLQVCPREPGVSL